MTNCIGADLYFRPQKDRQTDIDIDVSPADRQKDRQTGRQR